MGPGGKGGRRRWLLGVVFASYLAVVAFGVFGPSPTEQVRQAGQGARRVAKEVHDVVPSRSTGDERGRRRHGLLSGFSNDDIANVAVFVPFGALFPLLVSRWRWWTVPAGVALSASIELTQLLFLSWRSPTARDIVSNTVGTAIGFMAWLASWGWRRHRRRWSGSRAPAARTTSG
ncbi:MAG: VanZ family protein [Actinomycetota bacterium]|nr:VanZ family protein [Actinomycetota bacterium]